MALLSTSPCTPAYDRQAELTAFDETKTGVKGLVDAGITEIVNHGIPVSVLEEMRNGVLGFYEQDTEVKKQWYTRDRSGKSKMLYNSNFDLYSSPVANWRDTFVCSMAPNPPQPDELPPPCRF
ncbi:hypothetical protein L1887_32695 [Cichorium endivia]|nr:hypothetical protein L1887_32695 [Cichorium endivia]